MNTEEACIEAMRHDSDMFMGMAEMYKIEKISTEECTTNTDGILAYMLLKLLQEGNTKRYCLVRASIQKIVEKTQGRAVQIVDTVWKASLLGDMPAMKQCIEQLPQVYHKIGCEAIARMCMQKTKCTYEEKKETEEGNIQRVLCAAEQFFRI